MYFSWQQISTGAWIGCKSVGKPEEKNSNGFLRKHKQIKKLSPKQQSMSITELSRIYPLEEIIDGEIAPTSV